ncbi:methyltransferase domain-containing protein [Nocardioides sp. zg-536]|uniref:Methyltransferase domain-containing protein n=1 Tax=Nocardioides faecalis TaxID=2803858 RepID=A0A938Y0P8_9ACTN|nr:class I SAM-dependent methyltransferase [Nocardioides faecalis]MBM9459736.1 methyltransferase domain-containing protein [Nocardioides faecalis]MBS4753487.1 methyltransferase domain-containing protein [Nocardioides faecalis]QVI58253.1 methyltransferase domain-containing protein [Nocardioides faecalis]
MDLETFRWLLGDDGQALLAEASDLVAGGADALAAGSALRRTTTAERAAAALTQVMLRERAAAKFGDLAPRLYFTPDALEQATRFRVAEHRAGRAAAFGARTLIDLGCGIGGDLMAAARTGMICAGVDLDPVRVAIAEANLAALGLTGAVQVADATTVLHETFDLAFADPARRSGAGRSFRVEDWTPPWEWVQGLLARDACVKVAPGIPHSLVPDGVEAEWVSDDGEVKEAALWAGRTATARRRATVIGDGGLATVTDEEDPGPAAVGVRAVGAYLYEPDGAVVRAGLVTAVAATLGAGLLDERIAYVTGDNAFRTPFARGYRVLEELPYREKQLKAALRERGVGRLTIKKRGVEVVPETLRKRLALSGDAEATIVLTRVAGEGTALLVEPL